MEVGLEIHPDGHHLRPGTVDSIKEPNFQTLSLLYTYFGVIKLSYIVCKFLLELPGFSLDATIFKCLLYTPKYFTLLGDSIDDEGVGDELLEVEVRNSQDGQQCEPDHDQRKEVGKTILREGP